MKMLGAYNEDFQIGKKYFNNLIKNEDASETKIEPYYGDTRTIYTINENGSGIYLYHYYSFIEKLYRFRKNEMEKYDNLILSAAFEMREKCKDINNYYSDMIINSDDIGHVNQYFVSCSFFMEKKSLLEKFYRGELKNGLYHLFTYYNAKFMDNIKGFRPFFPHKINAFRGSNFYRTDQVINVPDSVRTLDYLADGDLIKYTSSSNISLEQLDCFEFDNEPYDEIGLDELIDFYGERCDKNIKGTTDSIIDFVIEQATANEEVMRLVKERR